MKDKKTKDKSEFEELAKSIRENIGDKKWAKLLDQKV
jgi:hypothetical protein|tara:strand:- start:65 stop:175 length:111 start_codon:yes stop_codon:yes gene_type:complete